MRSVIKLATYNIHRCIGTDGSYNPARISNVIRQLDADIIALQEVESFTDGGGNVLYDFETDSGFTIIPGPTMCRRDSSYGNAVMSRCHPVTVDKTDISQPGVEPRGVISLFYDINGTKIHIMSTHLGLKSMERRLQLNKIFNIMEQQPADISVLAGVDFLPRCLAILPQAGQAPGEKINTGDFSITLSPVFP